MKGSIRERSPGHWAIILDQRDPATGNRKRKWHSFNGTKRQAQTECARLIAAMKDGTYIEPSKITVAQFLDRARENGLIVRVVRVIVRQLFEIGLRLLSPAEGLLGGAKFPAHLR